LFPNVIARALPVSLLTARDYIKLRNTRCGDERKTMLNRVADVKEKPPSGDAAARGDAPPPGDRASAPPSDSPPAGDSRPARSRQRPGKST
jgi:hypothetical protein